MKKKRLKGQGLEVTWCIKDELGHFDFQYRGAGSWRTKFELKIKDLEEAARYIHKNSYPKIDLIIYQAEGYFVGEYVMEGRSGKTKAGWKAIKEFVERYSPTDFKVTYNGVKYKVEDNKELFKKLFDEL